MKKKILFILAVVLFCTKANAQWFVGGALGVGYSDERFTMEIKPSAGYEFNDRWAVGLGVGMMASNSHFYGGLNPYLRLNCWNNEKFFIDLKAQSDIWFNSYTSYVQIGLTPSLRYAITESWQLSGDIGFIGVQSDDGNWSPAFSLKTTNAEITLIYKF